RIRKSGARPPRSPQLRAGGVKISANVWGALLRAAGDRGSAKTSPSGPPSRSLGARQAFRDGADDRHVLFFHPSTLRSGGAANLRDNASAGLQKVLNSAKEVSAAQQGLFNVQQVRRDLNALAADAKNTARRASSAIAAATGGRPGAIGASELLPH